MDLAKDLAWQKIFRGRSNNLKIEKSGFFCIFVTLTPYCITFPDTQWAYKITTENINIKRSLSRLKKKLFFFHRFFLPLIASLTRKFGFFLSKMNFANDLTNNEREVHCMIKKNEIPGWD